MSSGPGNFIWYELLTSDVSAAAAFYGSVVGWVAADSGQPGMDYRLWSIGEAMVGGLMAIPPGAAEGGMRPIWLGYLNVADVDASIEAVSVAGGGVVMPATDIPGIGRMALLRDPHGAAFYVMAPATPGESTVFARDRPGHGGWHELHTTDWPAALAFYEGQFGWTKSAEMDMGPMGVYALFGQGGAAIGGMMNSPMMPRPIWLYYFNVDDITTAQARLEKAGGAMVTGPHQVPGGLWMLQATDPQGAMFGLLALVKS